MGITPSPVSAQHKIDPETWIEMRKMFRPKEPAPTVEEDIATLAGADAKRAGPRLIDLGPAALPAVHAALRSPQSEPLHGLRLLQVIRAIGDISSVPVVLELLNRDPKTILRRDALLVLARLGDKSVLEPISQLLTTGPPANSRDALMTSLTEITSPEEFKKRVPSSLAWSHGYKDSLLYTQYRAAKQKEKRPFCLKMLRSQTPGHLDLAVSWLLENGYDDELRPHAAIDLEAPGRSVLIRNDIRKAGWQIIDTDDEFRIVPGKPDKTHP